MTTPPRRREHPVAESSIPLVDVAAANAEVAEEIRAGFTSVMESGQFILGPDVAAFEEEFARFTGTRACVGLSSGTDALELALRAFGVGPGDEVIVPVNTFISTAVAVSRAGATPVFADCDPRHLLIAPEGIVARLTERTRAIVPVHLYGQMAPMETVRSIAEDHELFVLEDFAQSPGARQSGRSAGSLSLAGATSFYPAKNIGAFGDAGAVVTDDLNIADALRASRNYGSPRKYEHPVAGFNCRLDTLQAVVLSAKLPRLAKWNEMRRAAANRYDELLRGHESIRPLATLEGNEHVHHLYVVELSSGPELRDHAVQSLQAEGIGAGIHYPMPLHLTGAYAHLGHRRGAFPCAEEACDRILSLPIYPQLSAASQERVIDGLLRAVDA